MFRSDDWHGIKLCNCKGYTMIDWKKYDEWKLASPYDDEIITCLNKRCDNEPKKGEDYCRKCIEIYECHACDQVLVDEDHWQEISGGKFVCTVCYEKIIG